MRIEKHEFGDSVRDESVVELLRLVFVQEGYTSSDRASIFAAENLLMRGVCWRAESESMLLGVVFLVRPSSPFRQVATAEEAEIQLLAVRAEARGRGVGRALLKHAHAEARRSGFGQLVLSSQTSMTAAHRLYQIAGYRRAAARDWRRSGRSYWVFERSLQ